MSDKLYFYAYSADKPAGDGSNKNEFVSDKSKYNDLNQIKYWRRVFSSLWDGESFIYNNRTYRSVEHALQASKFYSAGYADTADSFSLESKSELSAGSGKDAHKARKIRTLTAEELLKCKETHDTTKWKIYVSKYSSGIANKVLLATGTAELWNAGPRIKTMRCITTEKVRDLLKNKSK